MVQATINVVNLPARISTNEVVTYFKGVGAHADIKSVKPTPESGCVQVEISGLTTQGIDHLIRLLITHSSNQSVASLSELESLKKSKHKIKDQDITVQILHHQQEPFKSISPQREPFLQDSQQQLFRQEPSDSLSLQQTPPQKLVQESQQQLVQSPDNAALGDVLEVSGLPHDVDLMLLEMYFESSRSGGCPDAVEKCTVVRKGTAHVKFQSPEGI